MFPWAVDWCGSTRERAYYPVGRALLGLVGYAHVNALGSCAEKMFIILWVTIELKKRSSSVSQFTEASFL